METLDVVNTTAAVASVGSFLYLVYDLGKERKWKIVGVVSVFALLLAFTVYLSTQLAWEHKFENEAAALAKALPDTRDVLWGLPGTHCSIVSSALNLMAKHKVENSILQSRAKICEERLPAKDGSGREEYEREVREVALLSANAVRLWAKQSPL